MKLFCFAIIVITIIGCGTTAVTRSTVTERPDSLLVQREPTHIEGAHSDSLKVELARSGKHSHVDTANRTSVTLDTARAESPVHKPAARRIDAKIDTMVKGIRIAANYKWPADLWNIDVLVSDTSVHWMVRDSLIEKPYPVEKIPLWVYLAFIAMIVALVALIIKR
jgi:hypothetical protein